MRHALDDSDRDDLSLFPRGLNVNGVADLRRLFNDLFMLLGQVFVRLCAPLPANVLLVLRLSPIPRPVCSHAVHRIAHPTDLTEVSENAFTWAIHLAETNNAELLLLHVVPPATPIFEAEPPTKARAKLELSLMLTQATLNGLRVRAFVLCGTSSIDHQILQAAELEKTDMIVMGTRGRTGLSKLLVGSVASRVISRALCPVLIIPSRLIEQPPRG